jgi:hypothetical protein
MYVLGGCSVKYLYWLCCLSYGGEGESGPVEAVDVLCAQMGGALSCRQTLRDYIYTRVPALSGS